MPNPIFCIGHPVCIFFIKWAFLFPNVHYPTSDDVGVPYGALLPRHSLDGHLTLKLTIKNLPRIGGNE